LYTGGYLKICAIALVLILLTSSGCLGSEVSVANWPDGYKSAVILSFDVEQAQAADILKAAEILEEHDADATFFVVAGYYSESEELLYPLEKYEIASKGWDQSAWSENPQARKDNIMKAHSWFESKGYSPVGFRSPFLKRDEKIFDILSELGYGYDSSETSLLPTKEGDVFEIPLSVSYDPFWNVDVESYLPLFYFSFEKTYEDDGLFQFYTYPEHLDERGEVFLEYISRKNVWLTSNRDVLDWWKARAQIDLKVSGNSAMVTNNGDNPISGVTLKLGEDYIVLEEIGVGETLKVEV
jgi:peptidoglycan/xylan/chitin deacetylase (PgdA/CDA1 family)